jgi:hypothetical protein
MVKIIIFGFSATQTRNNAIEIGLLAKAALYKVRASVNQEYG